MNKKLLILGISALAAGFFVFTSFDGKTREQQLAEIEQTVTMKLDELRAQKEQECTDKVDAEAQRRFDEILAQRAAEEAAKPGKKPTAKRPKGPRPDPTPVTIPTDPQKQRSGSAGNPTPEQQKERSGAAKPADVQTQKKRPGAAGGGGN